MASSRMDKSVQLWISCADMTGSEFVKTFYKMVDMERPDVLNFYRPISSVIYNGRKYGWDHLKEFFSSLPSTRHRIKASNFQPIPISGADPYPTTLVTVQGTVSYNGMKSVPFSQTFILQTEGKAGQTSETAKTTYFIVSDVIRIHSNVIS